MVEAKILFETPWIRKKILDGGRKVFGKRFSFKSCQ